MSTLDEITKEKQRVSEALARVDAQREKLSSQLGELKVTAAARSRGRLQTTTAKPTGGKRTLSTLGDQVLALATGKTQQEIAAVCKGARPNHVGVAISWHKRAGRIEEREGKLYAMQS